jgi:hypothetical protein
MNSAIPLTLLIPVAGWFVQFWISNFKTNDTEGFDLVARWCYLQRRRAGKDIAYVEYPEYESSPDDDKLVKKRRRLNWKLGLGRRYNPKLAGLAKKAHDPERILKDLEHLQH